jgi:gliding motility-associated-like protein
MINGKPVGTDPNFSTSNLSAGDIVQCFLIPDKSTCVVPGTMASNKMGIDIYPLPALNITPQKPVIHRNDSIQLQVTGSNISSYLWTPPVNISDNTVPNPYVWPKNSQEYTVTATSAKGCSNTKNILVEVVVDVHVPNAFSPNHDGKNDTWHISGLDAYPNCIVNIFNRWGQRVFYSTGYTRPWDGTFNNRELPSSTFIYVIDCKNGTRPISGTVTIIH